MSKTWRNSSNTSGYPNDDYRIRRINPLRRNGKPYINPLIKINPDPPPIKRNPSPEEPSLDDTVKRMLIGHLRNTQV